MCNLEGVLGGKIITVTEEAYRRLVREKRKNESFSEVIKRLTRDRGRLGDSLGAWRMSDKEAQEIFYSLRRHWKQSTMRLLSNARHSCHGF